MGNVIEIDNLNVKVKQNNIVEIDEKVNIEEQDIVGIIGENGSGKTTLINSILGNINYTGSIKCMVEKEKIGVQFQINHYNKLMKVYELIQIVINKRYSQQLKLLEIREYQIIDMLKKQIGKLSVGEIQRLTLFLVMYQNPKLFLFDELTTGLDFEKRAKLLKIVKSDTTNKTVLIITHYFEELANWASKLLILDKGKLVYFGTVENLFQLFPHYSIVQIPQKSNLVDFYNNHIISLMNEENLGIITRTLDHQENISDKLNKLKIDYQIQSKSLYTLYSIAVQERRRKNNV